MGWHNNYRNHWHNYNRYHWHNNYRNYWYHNHWYYRHNNIRNNWYYNFRYYRHDNYWYDNNRNHWYYNNRNHNCGNNYYCSCNNHCLNFYISHIKDKCPFGKLTQDRPKDKILQREKNPKKLALRDLDLRALNVLKK